MTCAWNCVVINGAGRGARNEEINDGRQLTDEVNLQSEGSNATFQHRCGGRIDRNDTCVVIKNAVVGTVLKRGLAVKFVNNCFGRQGEDAEVGKFGRLNDIIQRNRNQVLRVGGCTVVRTRADGDHTRRNGGNPSRSPNRASPGSVRRPEQS